ncbi:MAG: AraC family transcriptional regulator [Steroidobacteraceae bacterium]
MWGERRTLEPDVRAAGWPAYEPLSQLGSSRAVFRQYRGTLQGSITEAAYAAGFGSYAQFHRVFTQAYGKGPRECLTPRQRKE